MFFIALPASVNSQCKIVERAEWSWKNCTRLQKLGLKREKIKAYSAKRNYGRLIPTWK